MSMLWIVALVLAQIASFVTMLVLSAVQWADSLGDGEACLDALWAFGGVTILLGSLPTVILVAFIYFLVRRQNDHYLRELRPRSSIMELIRAASWSPERVNDVAPEVRALSMAEASIEKQRNPWFWSLIPLISVALVFFVLAVFTFVASVGSNDDIAIGAINAVAAIAVVVGLAILVLEIYLLYFLTKTMLEHDARWTTFA